MIFTVLFLIIGGIVYYWMNEFYLKQTRDALLQDITILSIKLDKLQNLDKLAQEVKQKLHLRLTVINKDGKVIAESHKDKSKMDNHRSREEIIQADKQSYGYIIRYSKTLKQDLLYVVQKYSYGDKVLYIRLARALQNINQHLYVLGAKVFAVLILFFITIFIVTYKIQAEVQGEMKKILRFLKSLAKKQKSTYITSDYSQEFSQITALLSKVSQILMKKEKKKSKYTAALKEANQQKDDIISAISHEFKNPIAVINGYSQTLLEDEELNKNIQKKFLGKIHKNGLKLNELIDTLRLSIKLDNGQQAMNFSKVNLYEVVLECIDTVKINHQSREIYIEGKKDIFLNVDKALFEVLLSNLLENALKYSEEKVLVHITQESVCVKDSGMGISKKDLANITNKFYRVHKNSWNNSLGLGLFLVNNIATLHHFKLKIESVENEGSSFCVVF
jgi:signal transduction histidine kinase